MSEQKLTIAAEAKGTEQTSKDVAKVGESVDKLGQKTGQAGKATAAAAKQTEKLNAAESDYIGLLTQINPALGGLVDGMLKGTKIAGDLASQNINLVGVYGKLKTAILANAQAFKLLGAASAVAAGIYLIVKALEAERKAREDVTKAIKAQSDAKNELAGQRRDQQQTIEDISDTRREGGFDPDTARAAATTSQDIGKKYERLAEGAADHVMGLLGDAELSFEQLVDAAILRHADKLNNVTGDMAPEQRVAALERSRQANSETIEKFRRRETVQGQGLGDAGTRPEYTERAKDIAREAFTEGEADELVRKRLKELGLSETEADTALGLGRMYGGAKGMKEAEIGWATLRPFETLGKKMAGDVDIGLINQPGYGSQAKEAMGIRQDYITLESSRWDAMVAAVETISKEGIAGFGQERADPELIAKLVEVFDKIQFSIDHYLGQGGNMDMQERLNLAWRRLKREGLLDEDDPRDITQREFDEARRRRREQERAAGGAEGGTTVINNTTNMQHARIVHTDAEAQRRNTVNGESDRDRREKG